jgi:hypothetical protein
MDAGELDIEDLPPKALRKLIRSMMAKTGKPRTDAETDKADDEREALANLKEETNGKAPKIPVIEDDLPPELRDDADEDEEEDEEEDEGKKPGKPKRKAK